MQILLHDDCFGIESADFTKEPELHAFEVPDALNQRRLMEFLEHYQVIGRPVSVPQLETLLEVLTAAEDCGYDVNRILLHVSGEVRSTTFADRLAE